MAEQSELQAMANGGCWLAYYADWSGWQVFASELDALRCAVGRSMDVRWLPWGVDPTERTTS